MRTVVVVLTTLLALILSLTAALTMNTWASAGPDNPPPKPFEMTVEELLHGESLAFASPSSSGEFEPTADLSEIMDWSDIVFQSYQDGNWEVYRLGASANESYRLTTHPGSDVYPRLNRGATRIVFSSDRSGNFELYSMKLDGTDMVRLTNTLYDEINPIWSPDGLQIIYQAYVNGQSDLFLMSHTGSGVKRLTSDSAYDGMPYWSPDGDKIVFASLRGGMNGLWLMNTDGTNKSLLASKRYIENPVWSPDGARIAYDADSDGDGFQELWIMNADGSEHRLLYNAGYQVDVWARGWTPDGHQVTFTRVHMIYHKGNWYWTDAYIMKSWLTGSTETIANGNLNMLPDWQTRDVQAPHSWVESLPELSRDDVVVYWGGADIGGSGVDRCDVQYRLGQGGKWIDWLPYRCDPPISSRFDKVLGETVYFRVRAVDRALNKEDWTSGDGDAFTTFYSWAISGTVRDTLDTPLANVNVDTTPGAFWGLRTEEDGRFQTLVASEEDSYLAGWSKEDYLTLPGTTFRSFRDASFDAVIPPADNVISGWNFESSILEVDGWTTAGTIAPAPTTTDLRTGQQAAVLGLPHQLNSIAQVAVTQNKAPVLLKFLLDKRGIGHLAWVDGPASNQEKIYYAGQKEDGSWDAAMSLNSDFVWLTDYSMTVCDDGAVHILYTEYRDGSFALHHRPRGSDGQWGEWGEVMTISEGGFMLEFCDPDGNLHLIWSTADTPSNHRNYYYRQMDVNGVWSAVETIAEGEVPVYPTVLPVFINDTELHLVIDLDGATYHTMRSAGGEWAELYAIKQPVPRHVTVLGIFADSNDFLHLIAGMEERNLHHLFRDQAGNWSEPVDISGRAIWGSPFLSTVMDSVERIHVTFYDSDRTGLFYTRYEPGQGWTMPTTISEENYSGLWAVGDDVIAFVRGSYDYPNHYYTMRLGSDGQWSEPWPVEGLDTRYDGQPEVDVNGVARKVRVSHDYGEVDYRIVHAQTQLLDDPGHSSISQKVTLPETLSHPLLSFFYRINDPAANGQSDMRVTLDNGLTSSVIYSATTSGDWAHGRADLSTWRGETVTVTLSTTQPAGLPRGWLYVDDFTIGSSYPDMWLNGCEDLIVGPGDTFTCQLQLGNRSSLTASAAVLTMTLPSELEGIAFSQSPLTIDGGHATWQLGDLANDSDPTTLVMTATVAAETPLLATLNIQAALTSATPEMELWNNSASLTILVAKQTFLPIVVGSK